MDFIHYLLFFHVGFGELAGICFLIVAVETFNRTEKGLARAKLSAAVGTVGAFLSWLIGGYYYVVHYGTQVKPVLISQTSTLKWAHKIIIEYKEHIFLFIPILAVTALLFYLKTARWSDVDSKTLDKAAYLSILIFLMSFLMAGLGALVSMAARLIMGGGV